MVPLETLAPGKGVVESEIDNIVIPVLHRHVSTERMFFHGLGIISIHCVLEILGPMVCLHISEIGVVFDAPWQLILNIEFCQETLVLASDPSFFKFHQRIFNIVAARGGKP